MSLDNLYATISIFAIWDPMSENNKNLKLFLFQHEMQDNTYVWAGNKNRIIPFQKQ